MPKKGKKDLIPSTVSRDVWNERSFDPETLFSFLGNAHQNNSGSTVVEGLKRMKLERVTIRRLAHGIRHGMRKTLILRYVSLVGGDDEYKAMVTTIRVSIGSIHCKYA
jgi:hypothetical protein